MLEKNSRTSRKQNSSSSRDWAEPQPEELEELWVPSDNPEAFNDPANANDTKKGKEQAGKVVGSELAGETTGLPPATGAITAHQNRAVATEEQKSSGLTGLELGKEMENIVDEEKGEEQASEPVESGSKGKATKRRPAADAITEDQDGGAHATAKQARRGTTPSNTATPTTTRPQAVPSTTTSSTNSGPSTLALPRIRPSRAFEQLNRYRDPEESRPVLEVPHREIRADDEPEKTLAITADRNRAMATGEQKNGRSRGLKLEEEMQKIVPAIHLWRQIMNKQEAR